VVRTGGNRAPLLRGIFVVLLTHPMIFFPLSLTSVFDFEILKISAAAEVETDSILSININYCLNAVDSPPQGMRCPIFIVRPSNLSKCDGLFKLADVEISPTGPRQYPPHLQGQLST